MWAGRREQASKRDVPVQSLRQSSTLVGALVGAAVGSVGPCVDGAIDGEMLGAAEGPVVVGAAVGSVGPCVEGGFDGEVVGEFVGVVQFTAMPFREGLKTFSQADATPPTQASEAHMSLLSPTS